MELDNLIGATPGVYADRDGDLWVLNPGFAEDQRAP